jgi:hypothetical protein
MFRVQSVNSVNAIENLAAWLNATDLKCRQRAKEKREEMLALRAHSRSAFTIPSLDAYSEAEIETLAMFRESVDRWLMSGQNLEDFLKADANVELCSAIRQALNKQGLRFFGSRKMHGHIVILPTMPRYKHDPLGDGKQDAALAFVQLVTNGKCSLLKKCTRCHRYYAALRNRKNKLYCTQKCGSRVTAGVAMRKKRERERREKLSKIHEICMHRANTRVPLSLDDIRIKADASRQFIARALKNRELAGVAEMLSPLLSRNNH